MTSTETQHELMRVVREAPDHEAFMAGLTEVARHDAIDSLRKLDEIIHNAVRAEDPAPSLTPQLWVELAGEARRIATSAALVADYETARR